MNATSAHELAKTHYCKTPGCPNEASSPVGRYSYCSEHQSIKLTPQVGAGAAPEGTAAALRALLSLAKRVDKAKTKAENARKAANKAEKAADTLADEYRNALAEAARA